MKKLLSIILTVLLLATLIGCVGPADKKDESSKAQETLMIEKTESIKKTQADKQVTVTEGAVQNKVEETVEEETKNPQPDTQTTTEQQPVQSEVVKVEEVLSAEDKAVKEEIEKYNPNTADFRSKKQEKIGDITYDLAFATVGYNKTDIEKNTDRITYLSSNDDKFVYNANTGKLRYVSFNTTPVDKTEKSIDISAAEKIAYKYASQVCDINEYELNYSDEIFNGYDFRYSRFVDDYRIADNVLVTIGFGGEIEYIGIFTDTFDGIELNINKEWIEQKTSEALAKHEGANPELKDQCIIVEDGKPCLQVIINYESTSKNVTTKRSNGYVYAFEE